MIKRKPIPQVAVEDHKIDIENEGFLAPKASGGAGLPEDAAINQGTIQQGEVCLDLDEQMAHLELEDHADQPQSESTGSIIPQEPSVSSSAQNPLQKSSKLKAALDEMKYFAGGLIAHPYEATKHYAVMRHSHGLVYYQGSATSVAITVFADQPLPADRKLWLQKRGFSGKTGLTIGAALGTRSAWIDVTPAVDATADILPYSDERAWQRDITKFMKKTKDTKNLQGQRPYETDIVRIPYAAEDGYFRLVLCAGRKVLCPSPIFRYITASLDPGHLRGASLTTLPLELGIKIGSVIARNAANTVAHGALQPATTYYQDTVQPTVQHYNPMGLTQVAAQTLYDESGAADRVAWTVNSVSKKHNEQQDQFYHYETDDGLQEAVRAIGGENGPQKPFPVKFSGIVIQGLGRSHKNVGAPLADLRNVPDDILVRFPGVYIGWASISKAHDSKMATLPEQEYNNWYQALITVAPLRDSRIKVVEQRHVSVHLIQDFRGTTFFGARLKVILMAFLHPADPISSAVEPEVVEKNHVQFVHDVALVRKTLIKPSWRWEDIMEHEASDRSFTDRAADAWQGGQKKIDKLPLHRLGLRTNTMGLRDELIGNGGICVKR